MSKTDWHRGHHRPIAVMPRVRTLLCSISRIFLTQMQAKSDPDVIARKDQNKYDQST